MKDNIYKKEDLVELLHQKTGFYKKHMREVTDALEEILVECLQSATFEHDSEIRLAPGLIIKGTRKPSFETVDPRTGESVMASERVVPSAIFKQSLKQKLYKKSSYYKVKRKKG